MWKRPSPLFRGNVSYNVRENWKHFPEKSERPRNRRFRDATETFWEQCCDISLVAVLTTITIWPSRVETARSAWLLATFLMAYLEIRQNTNYWASHAKDRTKYTKKPLVRALCNVCLMKYCTLTKYTLNYRICWYTWRKHQINAHFLFSVDLNRIIHVLKTIKI